MMNFSQKIWLVLLIVITLLLGVVFLFKKDSVGTVAIAEKPMGVTKSATSVPLPKSEWQKRPKTAPDTSNSTDNIAKQVKSFDETWCVAKEELSEEDYSYSQTEVSDWEISLGKAKANPHDTYIIEGAYPNHSYVEPYDAMSNQELKTLVNHKDDKWAMVSFIQRVFIDKNDRALQQEVANHLLIQGTSYHAIEYFVLHNMARTRGALRKANSLDIALNHVVEALAYVYLGLDEYNDAGISPFLSTINAKDIQSALPIELFLPELEQKIKLRYDELKNSLKYERQKQAIELAEAPPSVKRKLVEQLAKQSLLNREQVTQLNQLKILERGEIVEPACLAQHINYLSN